jgi:hypothetical protein
MSVLSVYINVFMMINLMHKCTNHMQVHAKPHTDTMKQ